MGRLKNGILGGISGKVGDVEGYIVNGIAYVRARKRKTKKAPTQKQLWTRMRMAAVNQFINSMTAFVRVGYQNMAKNAAFSANNAAKSYQLRHAVSGEYPDAGIDFSKVMLSTGTLDVALNPSVETLANGFKFSWDMAGGSDSYNERAQSMLLAYSPELHKSFFKIGGSCRYTGLDILEIPDNVKGKALECYLSFAADDREKIADSVYLGSVIY